MVGWPRFDFAHITQAKKKKDVIIEEDGIKRSEFLNWRLASSSHAKLCGAKAPPNMYVSQERDLCMKRGWDQLERVSVILEGLPYVTFDIHMSAYFFGVLGLKKNVRGAKNALFLSWLRKIRERESRNKILNETFKKELDRYGGQASTKVGKEKMER